MLPSDVTGTEIYRAQEGTFAFQQGPIFHNLILAMKSTAPCEGAVRIIGGHGGATGVIGRETFPLEPLFLVMATQNPIEQEGTYPLPEAQLDRFLMHVTVISRRSLERNICSWCDKKPSNKQQRQNPSTAHIPGCHLCDAGDILKMHMAPIVEDYIVQLTMSTRQPELYGEDIANWLDLCITSARSLWTFALSQRIFQGKDFIP